MKRVDDDNNIDDVADEELSDENDILVSIILTESTTSLLCLDLPNIEDCAVVEHSTCVIKPLPINVLFKKSASVFSYIFGLAEPETNETEDVTTEVAFFSDHFTIESTSNVDMAEEEDFVDEWLPDTTFVSDDEVLEPMERNLNVARVYMKPLLYAKTIVHENNIQIDNNEIIVNLMEVEEDSCSVCSELICRICHGGESAGDLIKPCRCRGTIALVHIDCLEHWLRESATSSCELCKHHYRIVREPKYGIFSSVFVYLSTPGENFREVLVDLLAFIFYTPSAIATTYMLMVICENMAKAHINQSRNLSAHLVAFFAIFGMAAIDFTYSSWLILTCQRHVMSWRSWYRNNSYLKLILPDNKKKAYSKKSREDFKIAGCSRPRTPTADGINSE